MDTPEVEKRPPTVMRMFRYNGNGLTREAGRAWVTTLCDDSPFGLALGLRVGLGIRLGLGVRVRLYEECGRLGGGRLFTESKFAAPPGRKPSLDLKFGNNSVFSVREYKS